MEEYYIILNEIQAYIDRLEESMCDMHRHKATLFDDYSYERTAICEIYNLVRGCDNTDADYNLIGRNAYACLVSYADQMDNFFEHSKHRMFAVALMAVNYILDQVPEFW